MERENLARYYADNVGLIHVVAKKGYARLMGMGASYGYDDMYQELSIIFIKAYDAFDENAGYKFSTYFMTSAYRQVNEIAKKIERERIEGKTRSVEEMASWSDDDQIDESELIVCPAMTPAQSCEMQSALSHLMANLSPLAARVVELTIDPPEFVEHELKASTVHARAERAAGGITRGKETLNVAYVCSLLEKLRMAPALDLRLARREIDRMTKRSFA